MAEIFNIWSKSQYFLKEEQNFISANEIDNMVSKQNIDELAFAHGVACLDCVNYLMGSYHEVKKSFLSHFGYNQSVCQVSSESILWFLREIVTKEHH